MSHPESVSTDLRNYLGQGAHDGQKIKLSVGWEVGSGQFVDVTAKNLAAEGDVNVLGYKGKVKAKLTLTGPGSKCRVELVIDGSSHVDENATYVIKGNTLEVYCKLFTSYFDEICLVFWQDGKYSNLKVWGKKGLWVILLHIWAYAAAGAQAQDDLSGGPSDASREPLRPSIAA